MLPRALSKTLLNQRWQRLTAAAGLTLIECLVAIIMIGLSTAAITPALVIAAATRVQSQKAEQAIQLAQGEIDRVRLLLETGRYDLDGLPPEAEDLTGEPGQLQTIGPPTAVVQASASTNYFTSDPRTARSARVGGSTFVDDFIIQAWRTPSLGPERTISGQDVPIFFNMGVRVYDRRAFDNDPDALLPEGASLGLTGGEGQRSRRPLAVIYASMAKGDLDSSLCNYFIALEQSEDAEEAGDEDDVDNGGGFENLDDDNASQLPPACR